MLGCIVLSDLGDMGQAFFPVTDRERVEGRPSNKCLHFLCFNRGWGRCDESNRSGGLAASEIRPETDICLVTSYTTAESWGLL